MARYPRVVAAPLEVYSAATPPNSPSLSATPAVSTRGCASPSRNQHAPPTPLQPRAHSPLPPHPLLPARLLSPLRSPTPPRSLPRPHPRRPCLPVGQPATIHT